MTTIELIMEMLKLLRDTIDLETEVDEEPDRIECEYAKAYSDLEKKYLRIDDNRHKIAALEEKIRLSKILDLCRTGK